MNKEQFLAELEAKMKEFDEIDRKGALDYYREIIEDRVEDGMTEEEAISSLGSVEEMLEEIQKFRPAVIEGRSVEDGFTNIWIDDSSADILFLPSTDDSAYVECMENENVKYDIFCKDGTLCIKRQNEERWYKRFLSFSLLKDVKLKIYLPARKYQDLTIDSNHGDIHIRGFRFARTKIKNLAGDINLEGLGGNLILSCMAGDVKIAGEGYKSIQAKLTAGDLTLKNGSAYDTKLECTNGDVTIERFFAGEIWAKSVNGDIDLDMVDATNYHLENVCGDIEGTILSYRKVEASSTMGNVKVTSDRGANGTLYAKTVMGDVHIKVREG